MTAPTQGLTEALFQRGALMDLFIGRWTGIKKMQPNDMLLAEDFDENAIYLGHKKLLPKKAMEKLIEIEGKARTALAARSVDFPIAKARFVTYSSLQSVIDKLMDLKQQWNAEVDSLAKDYPALMEEQLVLLDRQAQNFVTEELKKCAPEQRENRQKELDGWLSTQRAKNRSFYPTVAELKGKFELSWRMFTISALEGINELDAGEVLEAQARLREDLQAWVRTASGQIHQALGEAAANAKGLLEKNGKLTPRNLAPLFNAFENFLSVDFTGKSTFRDTIEEIKKRFLVSNPDGSYNLAMMTENLDSGNNRAAFESLLSTMSDLAVEETAEQAGIRSLHRTDFGRLVEL